MDLFERLDNAFVEHDLVRDPIAEHFHRIFMEAEEEQKLTADYLKKKVNEFEKWRMGKEPPPEAAPEGEDPYDRSHRVAKYREQNPQDPEDVARELLGLTSQLNKIAVGEDPQNLLRAAHNIFSTAYKEFKGSKLENQIKAGYSKFVKRLLNTSQNPTSRTDKIKMWSDDDRADLEAFLTGFLTEYYGTGPNETIVNALKKEVGIEPEAKETDDPSELSAEELHATRYMDTKKWRETYDAFNKGEIELNELEKTRQTLAKQILAAGGREELAKQNPDFEMSPEVAKQREDWKAQRAKLVGKPPEEAKPEYLDDDDEDAPAEPDTTETAESTPEDPSQPWETASGEADPEFEKFKQEQPESDEDIEKWLEQQTTEAAADPEAESDEDIEKWVDDVSETPEDKKRKQQLREIGSKHIQVKRTMGDKALVQVLGKDAAGNKKTKWITVNADEVGGLEPEDLEGRIWQHLKDKSEAYNAEKAELAQQAKTDPEAAARLKHVTSKFNKQWSGDLRSGMKNLETQARATKPEDFLGYLRQQLGESPKEMMINAYQSSNHPNARKPQSSQILDIITQLDDASIGKLKQYYKVSKPNVDEVNKLLQKHQQQFSPLTDDCNLDPYANLLTEAGLGSWLKSKIPSGAISSLGRQVSKMGKGLGRMLTSRDVKLAQQFITADKIVRGILDDPTKFMGFVNKVLPDVKVQAEKAMVPTDSREAVPGEEPEPMSPEEASQQLEKEMSDTKPDVRKMAPEAEEPQPGMSEDDFLKELDDQWGATPEDTDKWWVNAPQGDPDDAQAYGEVAEKLRKEREGSNDDDLFADDDLDDVLSQPYGQPEEQEEPGQGEALGKLTQKAKEWGGAVKDPNFKPQPKTPKPGKQFFPQSAIDWAEAEQMGERSQQREAEGQARMSQFQRGKQKDPAYLAYQQKRRADSGPGAPTPLKKEDYAKAMLADPLLEEIRMKANDYAHLALKKYVNRCNELGRTTITSMFDEQKQKMFSETLERTLQATQEYDRLLRKHNLGQLVDIETDTFGSLVSLVHQTSSPLTESVMVENFYNNPHMIIESYHYNRIGSKTRSGLKPLSKII
jgi:hypothetical protein